MGKRTPNHLHGRALHIHFARVMLAEARRSRHHPARRNFYWLLLQYAANARKRAMRHACAI